MKKEIDKIIKELLRETQRQTRPKFGQVLEKHNWETEKRIGIKGRRYAYDGFKNRLAIEIEWSQSERILPIMLKLQYGFVHNKLDAGVVVNHQGDSSEREADGEAGGAREIKEMQGIITVPILLVVFKKSST